MDDNIKFTLTWGTMTTKIRSGAEDFPGKGHYGNGITHYYEINEKPWGEETWGQKGDSLQDCITWGQVNANLFMRGLLPSYESHFQSMGAPEFVKVTDEKWADTIAKSGLPAFCKEMFDSEYKNGFFYRLEYMVLK